MAEPGDWIEDAACRGMTGTPNQRGEVAHKDLFFPVTKRRRAVENFDPERHVESADDAKKVCAGCSVRNECLDYALTLPEDLQYGVWGETTRRERRKQQREEKKKKYERSA